MAGAFPSLPFKKGAMEAEMPFHHRCRSSQSFGSAKDFLLEFHQTCPKILLCNFAYKFSPTMITKTFFGVTSKKRSSCVYLQTLGVIF